MRDFTAIKEILKKHPDQQVHLENAVQALGLSEDEVLNKVNPVTMLLAAFNIKTLGGALKEMVKTNPDGTKVEVPQREVLEKQVTKELAKIKINPEDNSEPLKLNLPSELVKLLEQKTLGANLERLGVDTATSSWNIEKIIDIIVDPAPSESTSQEVREEREGLGKLQDPAEDQ